VQSHPSSGFVPLFVAPSPEELGASLPQYEVLALLGQGGMGAVYKARQPKLDRFVAVKLLPAQVGNDVPGFAERFDREARAMAQLNHPNIVTVHDYGETEDGHRYIVMEYVQGRDLHAAIASGPLPLPDVLAWAAQICAGLDYAHQHQLVHRDVKPANILIREDGQVKVGDFGLAKLVGSTRDLSLTQSQVSLGTPDYASPEALQPGAELDHRADIYSFGVVLYQMLTGTLPRGAWKAPSSFRPVDPRLDRIVVKALQPDPDHRYQRMGQILEAFEDLKRNPAPAPAPEPGKGVPNAGRGNGKGRKRMHPALVALIAVVGVAVTTGVILTVAADRMGLEGFPRWEAQAKEPPTRPRPPQKREPKDSGAASPRVGEVVPVGPGKRPAEGGTKVTNPRPPALPAQATPPPRPGEDGWIALRPSVPLPVGAAWAAVPGGFERVSGGGDAPDAWLELWPPPPPTGYELRLGGIGEKSAGGASWEIRFPVRDDVARLQVGGEDPAGLTLRWGGRSESVATGRLTSSSGDFRIRVFGNGAGVGVEVSGGGQVGLVWEGDRAAGGKDHREEDADRRVRIRAERGRRVTALAFRSLPEDARIASAPGPGPRPGADPVSLLTKPEPMVSVPVPVPAPMPPPDPLETARNALAARVAELRTRYDGLEAELAVAGYERKMASLRESYQAALNRSLAADQSLPMEAAVQRELNRIRDREAIEDTDPPEIPETVRQLREVFRKESRTLDGELRLATAPILREHLGALQAVAQEPAWQDPSLAGVMEPLSAEIRRVEERLVRLSPAALPPAAPSAAAPRGPMPAPAPALAPAAMPGPSPAVRLSRASFPPVRPTGRGTILLRPRALGGQVPEEVQAVPKGLNGTVVDLAAAEGLLVALKSNGRVEIWGKGLSPEEATDITSVDRVAQVALAWRGERGQIALLLEDGSVWVRALGGEAPIPGLTGGSERIKGAVEVAVTPDGGAALRADGTLDSWGVFADGAAPPGPDAATAPVARVRAVGNGLVVLSEDGAGRLLGGEGAAAGGTFLASAGAIQDLWGGAEGGVVRVADGSLRPWGGLTSLGEALGAMNPGAGDETVVVGPGTVALGRPSGPWRFFGAGLDPGLEAAFATCRVVAITSGFVAGLAPE
jgi:tRNA A-37 threonylcarbamoyl transferase component Bud32